MADLYDFVFLMFCCCYCHLWFRGKDLRCVRLSYDDGGRKEMLTSDSLERNRLIYVVLFCRSLSLFFAPRIILLHNFYFVIKVIFFSTELYDLWHVKLKISFTIRILSHSPLKPTNEL